jgi:DNA gyrase subunit B
MTRLKNRGVQTGLVEILIKEGVRNKAFLASLEKMSKLKEALIKSGYKAEGPNWNAERSVYNLTISPSPKGQTNDNFFETAEMDAKPLVLGRGFVYSKDFQKALVLGGNILKHDSPPFVVFKNSDETDSVEIKDKKELLHYLVEDGKKGVGIQRYKGLGEMNPEQLWETTMNPEKRTLLQVKVEDDDETDEIFTVLMGEEVEPRREFIHNNALEVSTLDI